MAGLQLSAEVDARLPRRLSFPSREPPAPIAVRLFRCLPLSVLVRGSLAPFVAVPSGPVRRVLTT